MKDKLLILSILSSFLEVLLKNVDLVEIKEEYENLDCDMQKMWFITKICTDFYDANEEDFNDFSEEIKDLNLNEISKLLNKVGKTLKSKGDC